jgi:hypothetical protein
MQRASSGFGRIVQELSAWTKHDRQLTGVDMETLDQCLGVRIGLGVQPLVGMAIAPEKTFKPKHIPILRTSHDDRSAGAGFKEADATENQRAHNALAKLCLADQQCAQLVRRDDQGFDLVLRVRIDESGSARKLRQLAHERPRPMGNNVPAVS